MLAQLGDAWEEMYLEGEVSEGAEEEVNAMPMDAKNFRDNLKKTTLETNRQRGIRQFAKLNSTLEFARSSIKFMLVIFFKLTFASEARVQALDWRVRRKVHLTF
ncbi:hypothetical protein BGZ95_006165 [Linnemannia exigua]|uniref:Uncharacterized protein n=1 Tax=Linnemannia exigua TaxID=604196 RepID=A0AAD4D178_9FUNG|nr:hypothetical protein BGZ95_006165 [Linnemannia exigua]